MGAEKSVVDKKRPESLRQHVLGSVPRGQHIEAVLQKGPRLNLRFTLNLVNDDSPTYYWF